MRKITFIGGGSVQWTPGLISDIALTPKLREAEIVLHDIDVDAVQRMVPLAKRIAAHHAAPLQITGTVDRRRALADADAVVLCVGLGGLEGVRNDLEIPQSYGIYQSVGDTVGPGGLARALRHIPFALTVGREMEELAPEAWLVNLTNPMTTICRALTKTTSIRTIGLCHEVSGVQVQLAGLFGTSPECVRLSVAGINHLPVILACRIDGRDGLKMLAAWLRDNDAFAFVDPIQEAAAGASHSPFVDLDSPFEVFGDALAVKLTLFERLGVLFGAGDRHVAEFLPGFLDAASGYGQRYGVHLTTADHRAAMLRRRQASIDSYRPPRAVSDEQVAPLLAALFGGPQGNFVVNVPNVGQVANLPRDAVVECVAHVDDLGVRPLAVGDLPSAAHAIVAPHVDRQELTVEATLSGNWSLAEAALASDPLVPEPGRVAALFEDLMRANARHATPATPAPDAIAALDAELAAVNAMSATDLPSFSSQSLSTAPPRGLALVGSVVRTFLRSIRSGGSGTDGYSVHTTTIGAMLDDESTRAILERHFPQMINHPQIRVAAPMTLTEASRYAPQIVTDAKIEAIETELRKL